MNRLKKSTCDKDTDLLMKQFNQIKEERPDSDYEQGPLLALNLIYGNM